MAVAGRTDVEARSPADVLRLVTAVAALLALLLVEWLFGESLVAFWSQLLRGVDAVPDWIVTVVVVGTRLLTLAVLVGGLVWTAVRAGWRMAATAGLAAVTAAALRAWLDGVPSVSVGPALARLTADLGPVTAAGFPGAAGIAALAAAVTASAPWLARRWRRAGHAAVAALVVLRFFTAPLSFDSLEAAVVGWVSGAAVLVLLGGPSRRPSAEAIVEGLAAG
ncbi:MAG TPA: hypothetical protein VGP90_01940, partial [Acidimicrobiia bacterium]|nr:hypothetical protein [Acidimicrobiia bacterium]